jgi:DNA-binding beta-propeller fold protein YncE/outer membrane protein OmpA-like peptidoglycan-associated protein
MRYRTANDKFADYVSRLAVVLLGAAALLSVAIPTSLASANGVSEYAISASAPASGVLRGKWGSMGSGNGEFSNPWGIAVAPNGDVFVTDNGNDRIQRFSSTGTYMGKWGSSGSGDAAFDQPSGIAVAPNGDVYVADIGHNRIQYFSSAGTYKGKWGSYGLADDQLDRPYGIAVAPNGDVYVADTYHNRIKYFSSSGTYRGIWGASGSGDGQFNSPFGIAVAPNGDVYVADTGNHRIQRFSSTGTYGGRFGASGSGDGQLSNPYGVAVASNGDVFVADTVNHRIQRFSSTGTYSGKWGASGSGDGQFTYPNTVAVAANGDVYVADKNNNRAQYFGAHGTITPSGVTSQTAGTNATYAVTPDVGYGVQALTVDGELASLTDGKYVFQSVSATHTISVTFAPFYTVHFNPDGTAGSSVSSMTQTVVEGGATSPVTANPPAGYHFTRWTGTGSFETTTANPLTVSSVSAEMTVTAEFASSAPTAPYAITWAPTKGGTLIQWAGSQGATGYQVWLGAPPANPTAVGLRTLLAGRLLGTAGPSASSLFAAEYLGPNATIYVIALGDAGGSNSAPVTGVYTASVTPVQMGTVRFTGNSSKLTRGTKTALRRVANLLAAQGFTTVKVSGYTAKFDHGSKSFRRRLSLARAKKVKAYLAAELKRLHAHVNITTAGYGGASPVASNSSKSGAARNRRAELLLK